MKKIGLIGKNIYYSKSPELQNEMFRLKGIDAHYNLFSIDEAALPATVDRLRAEYLGFNVTQPYKLAIVDYLASEHGIGGAVNTVKVENGLMHGYNSDGIGFMRSLDYFGIDYTGKDVLMLGAGGAARTLAYMLDQTNNCNIYIYNRTTSKAEEVIRELKLKNAHIADLDELAPQMIINATTLGLHGEMSLPQGVKEDKLETVVDVNYNPICTPLLQWAYDKGYKTCNGMGMLVFQAIESQRIWFGHDLDYTQQEIEKLLKFVESLI